MARRAESPGRPGAIWAAVAVLAATLWAQTARAESADAIEFGAVGLEAAGVDVRASLRGDLDVRDGYNRPVSPNLVERQLAGAYAAADPGKALSRLPMIQALWSQLNRVLLGSGLRGGRPASGGPSQASCPWRLPEPLVRLALSVLVLAVLGAQTFSLRPAVVTPESHPSRPLVLRC